MEEERAKKEPNRPKIAQDGAKMIQHGAKMEPRWPRVAQDEAKMAQYGGDMIQDGGGSRIAIIKLASNRMAIAKVGSRIPQLPAKHRQEANETHTLKSLRSRRWSRPAPQQMLARALASSSRCVSGDQAKKLYIKTPDQPPQRLLHVSSSSSSSSSRK